MMFFRSRLLQVMKKSSDNYHASLGGLFRSSNLEAGLNSRERESSAGCEREREREESSSMHITVQQPSPRPGSSGNGIIHTM